MAKCIYCVGDGELDREECDLEDQENCDECGDTGTVECQECDGTGEIEDDND